MRFRVDREGRLEAESFAADGSRLPFSLQATMHLVSTRLSSAVFRDLDTLAWQDEHGKRPLRASNAVRILEHKLSSMVYHAKRLFLWEQVMVHAFGSQPSTGIRVEHHVEEVTTELEAFLFQTRSLLEVLGTLTANALQDMLDSHPPLRFTDRGSRLINWLREKSPPETRGKCSTLADELERHVREWIGDAIDRRDDASHYDALPNIAPLLEGQYSAGVPQRLVLPKLLGEEPASDYANRIIGRTIELIRFLGTWLRAIQVSH
ncbi:MAG: hypothetical protein NTX53_19675 [candidate division WOR-3 bacterium]|nr:hypothetical protein [candidate division WOR-3 bacterium]